MNPLLYPVAVPILLGFICLLVPRRIKGLHEGIALAGAAAALIFTFYLFLQKPPGWTVNEVSVFRADALSGFILLGTAFFTFLIVLYSIVYFKNKDGRASFYSGVLLTLGAAAGAVLSSHLILLLCFWGFTGITLYFLVMAGKPEAAGPAKKSLVIIGGSDALMLFGIAVVYVQYKTFDMSVLSVSLSSPLMIAAFFCLVLGAFAKAGSMPMHTWIPDISDKAPVPVTAFLPASLDKLLGIYLLFRLCGSVFQTTSAIQVVLMAVGSMTILGAVMLALIQHDMRKLLAYHAVSQVGYMVLGIGTGTVVGLAGGLFHMLNHTIYKTGLFLAAGSVKHKTGTTDLNRLGGLAKWMPWTFAAFLICALSISGLPPFNGFVSKWMVYQGLFELAGTGQHGSVWFVWLVAALFGSGLTLASFMKLTHSVFLGIPSPELSEKTVHESRWPMVLPMAALALLCIVFGIFARSIPLNNFIEPVTGEIIMTGLYLPGFATIMILLGLLIGLIIYWSGNVKHLREADAFVGGEVIPQEERLTGTRFYDTIKSMPGIRQFYRLSEQLWLDIYEKGCQAAYSIGNGLRALHTGLINLYLVWVAMGLIILIIVLMAR